MSDAPHPTPAPEPGGSAPSTPPYAAAAPPASPASTAPSVPPYARGVAHQPYPGAPPVWTAPPPGGGSRALAGTALGLAIVGGLGALIPFGITVAWLFLLAAIVLAIIALARRAGGRGMSVAALVVSGAGIVVAVLWGIGFALFGSWLGAIDGPVDDGGYDEGYDGYEDTPEYVALGVEEGTGGSSRADALPYGTTVTVVDDATGEAVWELTVQAPQDVTSSATTTGASDAPVNGAYLAVPIEVTNLTDSDVLVSQDYAYAPYAWLLTGDGGRADATYLPGAIEEYPPIWDLSTIAAGDTATYYESFDVAASVAGTGYLVLDFNNGDVVYWGPVSAG